MLSTTQWKSKLPNVSENNSLNSILHLLETLFLLVCDFKKQQSVYSIARWASPGGCLEYLCSLPFWEPFVVVFSFEIEAMSLICFKKPRSFGTTRSLKIFSTPNLHQPGIAFVMRSGQFLRTVKEKSQRITHLCLSVFGNRCRARCDPTLEDR